MGELAGTGAPIGRAVPDVWKVLIVDDDVDVHTVTRLALENFNFNHRGLKFISAYSASEAKGMVKEHPDAAVVLLDVVMESDQAGLGVVRYIREEIENHLIRIVLRTGHPGIAPEHRIVRDYDINDYREKTELTGQKLMTLMYATLRSFRDIQQLRQQGLRLAEAQTRALEASRAKSQFLANISHELRTPLNGILGLSQMMYDEVLGPLGQPKYKEYAWDIHASGEILLAKIESVLEIAEGTDGETPLREDEFGIVALIQDCLVKLQGNKLDLSRRKNGALGRVRLRADENAVRRMLINLISNALKHGGGADGVRVAARLSRDGALVVAVKDRGAGVPADVITRLGEPFTVENNAYVWSSKGVGLGLAICKRLIERHDGGLSISSPEGQGTTVELIFPPERVIADNGGG
tara:strand:- start:507 stop:1733 length:1227 start_codon:yes stop_codon:yes gene_type:complete